MINRKLLWVSSLERKNEDSILNLEQKLTTFYKSNTSYYKDIDFTANNWTKNDEKGYLDILETAKQSSKILEVGCGTANILKDKEDLQEKYCGSDFSRELMCENSRKYPKAFFTSFEKDNNLSFDDSSFDFVFSVFVLEHCTTPAKFLDECVRVLKRDGILVILCPDFLGCGRMTSQRAGLSEGTSSSKLKKGKFLDALITLFDNRIRIPLYCRYIALRKMKTPKFLINISPVIFEDTFVPDVDAVYITYRKEIVHYLNNLSLLPNSASLVNYEKKKRLIYLKFKKTN